MKIKNLKENIYQVLNQEETKILYQGSLEGCEAYVHQNQNRYE